VTEAQRILDALSEEQRAVVTTLRGPVCVLAGAGTGKTRTIAHRIAYGIATGAYTAPRVFAITFTAKAAHEMRTRLAALGVEAVSARTFHAAALAQLGFFWPQIVGGNAPQVLPGKSRTLAQAAELLHLTVTPEIIRDVATEIEWRKVRMLSIDQYETGLTERTLPRGLSAEAMLDMHRRYEELKDERRQLDFEDVLLVTAGMLETEPNVALQVREQYRFFTVDEYQDVSPLQHALLKLWLGERQDLCVVGDPSQTIFAFTGATNEYLLQFGREFPSAQTFQLQTNYRSRHSIIAAANQLIAKGEGAIQLRAIDPVGAEKATEDRVESSALPQIVLCDNEVSEARWIAQQIAQLVSAGTNAADIAVLYRINAQAAALESALLDAGVSYHVQGSKRFFDRSIVRQALMTLRGAALAPTDEPLYRQVGGILRSLGWTVKPPSGRAQRESWEALNAIYLLADEADEAVSFVQFVDDLSARARANVEPQLAAVTLTPIHSAKGLEWPIVFVAGCTEGLLPISYADSTAAVAEERRLFYVAMTRAERQLTFTAPTHTTSGRGQQLSRFIAELRNTVTTVTADSRSVHAG